MWNQHVSEIDTGSHHITPSLIAGTSSNSRCFSARKSGKRWKRRYYLQQKARQERLNSSRKWKVVDHAKLLPMKDDGMGKSGHVDVLAPESSAEGTSGIIDSDDVDEEILSGEAENENLSINAEDNGINLKKGFYDENRSCVSVDSTPGNKGDKYDCSEHDASLVSIKKETCEQDEDSSSEQLKSTSNSKRHCDRDLDNPKPCKSRRAIDDSASLSRKYSNISFCSFEDCLPDGFFDAGRERPFLPLRDYEQNYHLDSREVILVDR